jgi:hypothetical protein
MICCGSSSGSDFGKVFVPVPAPVPTGSGFGPSFGSRQHLALFSKTEKWHKIVPFQCQNQLISQNVGLSSLIFFSFLLRFMLDPDSNPVPEPDQRSSGSCGSVTGCGSTTLLTVVGTKFLVVYL